MLAIASGYPYHITPGVPEHPNKAIGRADQQHPSDDRCHGVQVVKAVLGGVKQLQEAEVY